MSQSPKQMETDEVLSIKLKALRVSHRELDDEIKQLEETSGHDVLAIRRLKKRKLLLKDEISAIEDKLTPDIIA
jgi:hypothetical protein